MMADAQEIPDAPQFGPRRLGYHFRTGEVAPAFQWKDGFEMSFAPLRASAGLTMYAEQADAMGALAEYTNGQFLWVSFGGPSVGARVQEIRRSHQIEEPVDTQVMLDSITAKYGSPSRVKAHGNFWIDVAYYYKDGQLVAEGDRRRTKLSLYCKQRWSCFFDQLAARLRWIRVSYQAAILMGSVLLAWTSFGVKMPWVEWGRSAL